MHGICPTGMTGKDVIGDAESGSDQVAGLQQAVHTESVRAQEANKTIHTFIISWFGKHDNADRIAEAVALTSDYVSVIYSDPDGILARRFSCESIRRPNDLFFGDKFQTCINSCDADILLVIHADCTSDNWTEVPRHCRSAVEQNRNIGVWAPFIDYIDWSLNKTEIDTIPNSSLSIVAQTDSTVFALTREIVDRMRKANYEGNIFGWGIDLMFNYYTYSIGKISVVDKGLLVYHPRNTEYSGEAATQQLVKFLQQLTPAELIQSVLLHAIIRLRVRVEQAENKDQTVVADTESELALSSERMLQAENNVKIPALRRVSDTIRFWFVALWSNGGGRRHQRH